MDISNSNNNINNYISNDQLQKKLCNDYEELFKKLSVQTTPYLKKNNKKVPYRKRNLNFDQYKKVNYNNSNEKSFSLIDMNFMERMEHFNNKKTNDIQKMQNYLTNIESYIHTFHPEMNSKSKNIVNLKNSTKINSKQKTENVNNKKLINYDRINELYLDYKNRNIKIKKLTKENDHNKEMCRILLEAIIDLYKNCLINSEEKLKLKRLIISKSKNIKQIYVDYFIQCRYDKNVFLSELKKNIK